VTKGRTSTGAGAAVSFPAIYARRADLAGSNASATFFVLRL
jgi:hypothetical protein